MSQIDANGPSAEAAGGVTVDDAEIARFAAMAGEWWNPKGKFRPLHRFNPVRLQFIVETLCNQFARSKNAARPLEGLRILDVGCGGGLLSEPLARLGAQIVGIDAARSNVEIARLHAAKTGLSIDYRHASAETLAAENKNFDAVLAMEVIEHVTNVQTFLSTCAELLKPSALLLVATLNRSVKAYALAIVGAEYVLGWLPRGTHDWRKFITPEELDAYLKNAGLATTRRCGMTYHPLRDKWLLSEDLSVNYMAVAIKP